MLSCLTRNIDRLSHAVLNIAAPSNNNTKLPQIKRARRFVFGVAKRCIKLLNLEFLFMLYLYWILFFLKNFLDYKKIDVRIQKYKL